ncbi:MAG TPA: hypothetical protein VHD56_00240 [Tepidisphaeraceae bacterium]|nr:hypothetical protein [Tepidisphaeraceae bacterium]
MAAPRFLSLLRIIELHRDSIDIYGGDPGVRDMGLLESAIAQPRAMYGGRFLHEDLPAMAGAYPYHLVINLAAGKCEKSEIISFLKKYVH